MYEYKTLFSSTWPSEGDLNTLAEDGWRLIQIVDYDREKRLVYLEREIQHA